MSGKLFNQLSIDSKMIIQEGGFNNTATISRAGDSYTAEALTPAHHTRIDSDGFVEISGEKASVTFHTDDMITAGFCTAAQLQNLKGAIVTFTDANMNTRSYYVQESRPDYVFSLVVLFLGKAVQE
jgi:hypothetical protein